MKVALRNQSTKTRLSSGKRHDPEMEPIDNRCHEGFSVYLPVLRGCCKYSAGTTSFPTPMHVQYDNVEFHLLNIVRIAFVLTFAKRLSATVRFNVILFSF